ncbi:deoxyribodipyrimidine photo-lyase [Halanaeroarchaeum sp. HSR-CO]|uniref:cryptochrome/photolyase family protein n=1 Tax=Halanaeroarchaeum sp. HSR-CO TaxID=2866382 RepID=UPI00217D1F7D|nr:deoxyribodipyrimidine photo-lyase [Halanaeroarchaeum sp. HSR-CO]
MTLFWHRRDLRTIDNAGLDRATAHGSVVPIFCLDDDILQYAGRPRVRFMLEALRDLRKRYRDLGTDLIVVHGDPSVQIPAVAAEYDADTVVWNDDYSGLAQERDESVEDALLSAGFDVDWVQDLVLHEPGSIRTSNGDPYSVFSYYWKKWQDREKESSYACPEADAFVGVSGNPIPGLEELGFEQPDASIPDGTRQAAIDRLRAFIEDPIFSYSDCRDVPAEACTSRLSQDLKFGLVGIREVYEATERAKSSASSSEDRESVREFQRQLAWREFYAQVLTYSPETVTENFKSYTNPISWKRDEDALDAWKRGQTGYPIVDAGMRQLLAEGYMHNRVRMIVASFLTKDLLVDWREGYRWFRDRLVDHDTANDVGGWQWAASTGTDAQPYFRIFNPMTQGERYDPEAQYITEYVEELRNVDAEIIHDWTDLSPTQREANAPAYPAPIVDHAARREAAIAMFERARADD